MDNVKHKEKGLFYCILQYLLFFWLQSTAVIPITSNCKWLVIVPTTPSNFSVYYKQYLLGTFSFILWEMAIKAKMVPWRYMICYIILNTYLRQQNSSNFEYYINTIFCLNTVCSYKQLFYVKIFKHKFKRLPIFFLTLFY